MPQIQVLPSVPSFGTQLAQVLGEAGGDIGQGLVRGAASRSNNSMLEQLKNPNLSPMEKITIATRVAQNMSPDQAKTILPFYAPFMLSNGSPNQAVQPDPSLAQQGTTQQFNNTEDRRQQLRGLTGNPYFGDAAKEELADIRAEQKLIGQESRDIGKESREEIRKFAEPYADMSRLKTNVNKLKEAKKLIESGKVSFDDNKFRNAFVAQLEGNDNPMAELFKTDEQQKLWSLMRDSLNPKEIGGSNPSTKEVLIAMASLPNPYKGQQANEYIIESMINQAETAVKKAEKIGDLRIKNPKLSAADFKGMVDEDVAKFAEENEKNMLERISKREASSKVVGKSPPPGTVWMVSPDGNVGSVPKDRIEEAKANGYGDI